MIRHPAVQTFDFIKRRITHAGHEPRLNFYSGVECIPTLRETGLEQIVIEEGVAIFERCMLGELI